MAGLARGAAAFFLWSASACSTPSTARLGRYLIVSVEDESRTVCLGTGQYLDRYVERVFALLEEPIPDDFEVVVTDEPCRSGRKACYLPDEDLVHAAHWDSVTSRTLGLLRHELTHAILDRVWGRSIPFLEEGFTESLARTSLPALAVASQEPAIEPLIAQGALEFDYLPAARFVRFLIDTRGIRSFRDLFRQANRRDAEAILAAFESVYGASLAVVEAEFRAGGPRCTFQLDTCGEGTAIPVTGWRPQIALYCDDPDVFGTDETWMSKELTVEIPSEGSYVLGGAPMIVSRCGACPEQAVYPFEWPSMEMEVLLGAGTYSIEVQVAGQGGEVLTPYIRPQDLPVGPPRLQLGPDPLASALRQPP